jgi:hypothetical protein
MLACLALLWASLLRHRASIIGSLGKGGTFRRVIRALVGDIYHFFWVVAIWILAGSAVDRWYLGIAWLGPVPDLRVRVVLIGISGGLSLYIAWLWCAVRGSGRAGRDRVLGLQSRQGIG